jgi:hypothetical protein
MNTDERNGWVRGGNAPPPGNNEPAYVPAAWVQSGAPWKGYILGRQMICLTTHWDARRSVPCPGDPCRWCGAGSPKRVQYYVSAWDAVQGRDVILVMPARLAAQVLDLAQHEDQLRGLSVVLRKLGHGGSSRYESECVGTADVNAGLRGEVDVIHHLKRIFGVSELPGF